MWAFRDPLQKLLDQVAASGRKRPEREAMWTRLVNETDCRRMAEIGVCKGELTRRLLSERPTLETCYLIDPPFASKTVYPKVRPGGFLGGDDFCDNIWQHSREFEPSLVCPFVVYFAEAVDAEVFILPCQQFLIRKPAGATRFRVVDVTGRRTKFDVLSRI